MSAKNQLKKWAKKKKKTIIITLKVGTYLLKVLVSVGI